MNRFGNITELQLAPQDVADIDHITRDLRAHIGDPRTQEHELLDNIGDFRQQGRARLPELSEALDDLVAYGDTLAVIVQLPEATSDCYGPTPAAHPTGQNLYPSDIYRALFGSMAGAGHTERLWAFNLLRHEVIQNNVLVPHYGQGVITGDHRKKNADPTKLLELHTDGVYQNFNQGVGPGPGEPNRDSSPDFIALHTVRNKERAHLMIAAPNVEELTEGTLAKLRESLLPLGSTDEPHLKPVPVLYGPDERPFVRYNHGEFTGDDSIPDEDAQAALKEFDEHLSTRTDVIATCAGTIIFLNNRLMLHGRDTFTPLLNGEGRWVRRLAYALDAKRIQAFLPVGAVAGSRLIESTLVRSPHLAS
jgi:hypothetical protein